jgi:hypothetical protein
MTLTNWVRKLFSGRPRRPIVNRPARLGLESLDDRCLPSVTAAFSGGVLTITANTANTVAQVFTENIGGTKYVAVADNYAGLEAISGPGTNEFGAELLGNITGIVYDAGANPAKSYSLINTSGLAVRMSSGGQLFDTVASGQTVTDGLAANGYTYPSELNAAAYGGITAYLNPAHTVLTIAGPTGGGFQLDGKWTDQQTAVGGGEYTHDFTAQGTVRLETGLVVNGKRVEIPLPSDGLFGVTTQANLGTSPVGEYAGITLDGSVPLTGEMGGGNAFGDLLSMASLSVGGTGGQWGIALGSSPVLQSLGMPLLADVPYLYMEASVGETVSFGSNISASTAGGGGAIVFDPADPAVYVQGGDSQVGTFSGGVSLHGAIPYTPNALPPGVSDPGIYGNVYLSANGIALGDLPLAVSGSLVLGLDANHDGKLLSLVDQSAGAIKTLIDDATAVTESGGAPVGNQSASLFQQLNALAQAAPGAIDDLDAGLNGTLAVTTEQSGISLNFNAATGSVFVKSNADGSLTAAFDVQTVDPFAGTALDNLAPKLTAEVGGHITTGADDTGVADWEFTATAKYSSFAGFSSDAITIEADSTTMTADVQVDMHGLLNVAQEELTGTVDLRTGAFDLSDTMTVGVDLKVATVQMTETFDIGWSPTAGFHASADLEASAGPVSFDAELSLSVSPSDHVDVSGSGTVSVKDLGSASVGFDDDGFYFSVASHKVNVDW